MTNSPHAPGSHRRRQRIEKWVYGSLAVILCLVVLWIDANTNLWQNLVILAGIVGGIITFLLTALILERIFARAAAKRWAPVNRLALTEFLHAIADEEASEFSRGTIAPLQLSFPHQSATDPGLHDELERLRHTAVRERRRLSNALSDWAEFLSVNGSDDPILLHIAGSAAQLERVRDSALELEAHPTDEHLTALHADLSSANAQFGKLVQEIEHQIEVHAREMAQSEDS